MEEKGVGVMGVPVAGVDISVRLASCSEEVFGDKDDRKDQPSLLDIPGDIASKEEMIFSVLCGVKLDCFKRWSSPGEAGWESFDN
jgi:hypothetical protein